MKTADDIKKGLALCADKDCMNCPYRKAEWSCRLERNNDALALIQQLEAERDALREGLKLELGCNVCKHFDCEGEYVSNECMDCGKKKCNWEWRGVQKEEHEE